MTGFTVGQITRWIDGRLTALCLQVVAMAIGAVGAFALLANQLTSQFTSQVAPASAIFTMFLVGYGLDSFVDIFVDTVGQRAASQAAAVKNQLAAGEAARA